MEFTGEFRRIFTDWSNKAEIQLTLALKESLVLESINEIKNGILDIKIEPHSDLKTNAENNYWWVCIQQLARKRHQDKWDLYLEMLRKYGQGEYREIRADAYRHLKNVWREVQIVGQHIDEDELIYECILYYGISQYSKAEMAEMIDCILDEMVSEGLQPPPSRDMLRSIKDAEVNNYQ